VVDAAIAGVVRAYLRNLRDAGIPVEAGIVFGSHARGQADEWSDIDLVVLSPRFDEPFALADVEALWVAAGRTDSRIEPVPCGERQWVEDDASEILEIARREGQEITVRSPA
jgi:predicted nucleotidyltransferase